jgi:hypothetical protein
MNLFALRYAVVAGALLLSACSRVSERQAHDEFQKANPNAKIYEQFVGEGDSDDAYMHFRYTISGSDSQLEQMWLYQKQKDGSWRAVAKDGPKPAGSKFGD